ncbi:MAG: hypothetical protein JXR81_09425 [Candidatus Goldbacteria bacterium]|nr:hypothetical protein [Candidatus Goldiibacteriota bacterium]
MRKFLLTVICILWASSAFTAGQMTIGMGLNGVSDWTTEWPFVDIMKISREWFTFNADYSDGWDTGYGASIPLDSNLYPSQVPFDPDGAGPAIPQAVRTVWAISHLPTGNYTFICEGTGTVSFNGNMSGSFTVNGGGTFTVSVLGDGNAWMDISQSQAGDNLRNMRLIMPGYESVYQTEKFHPEFTSRISMFKALRFMDWGATNDSSLANWADRPHTGDYSYTRRGVPYEVMIELANKLNIPPWLCVPHMATDDYITQLARLIRDNLNSNLRVYLEYSNETWNWQFGQTNYCEDQGELLGFPSFFGYRWAYHCKRACDIWRIFTREFGNDTRFVKVLASQAGWGSGTEADPYPIQFMLEDAMTNPLINPDGYSADAIAIAPYFAPTGMGSLTDTATVDQVITLCLQDIDAMNAPGGMVAGHKAVADEHGVELVCYEGGQHMVRSESTALTDTFIAVNRDPRIYGVYTDYLDKLDAAGVGLFCHFVDCGDFSRWGMWGSMEYQNQPVADAHKYRALADWNNISLSRTPTVTVTNTPVFSATATPTITITCMATATASITPTHEYIYNPAEEIKAQPSNCMAAMGCNKIMFTGLPLNAKLFIYDITGGLVFSTKTDSNDGTYLWEINKSRKAGRIAAGIYIYVATDSDGRSRKGRLAIIP